MVLEALAVLEGVTLLVAATARVPARETDPCRAAPRAFRDLPRLPLRAFGAFARLPPALRARVYCATLALENMASGLLGDSQEMGIS